MFVAGKKRKAAPAPPAPPAPPPPAPPPSSAPEAAAAAVGRWHAFAAERLGARQYRDALDYLNRAVALAHREGIRDARLFATRSLVLRKLGEVSRAQADASAAVRLGAGAGAGAAEPAAGGTAACDFVARLPAELSILVLRLLDTRALFACRAVSRRWRALVDSAPVLWSRPSFAAAPDAVAELAQQLPAYAAKLHRGRRQPAAARVPPRVLRGIFERSRGALQALVVPAGPALDARALDALLAHRRPRLERVDVARGAVLSRASAARLLAWGLAAGSGVAAIRMPHCAQLDDALIGAIARRVPRLRVLDISGCANVRVRQLFRAWGATLADARDATALEELRLDDHPGIPEFFAYSARHRHFSALRVLHAAIRDQAVYARVAGLGPLLDYLQRTDDAQPAEPPFPRLRELNIDGVWDAAARASRFESRHTASLVARCRLAPPGLERLSALDAADVAAAPLLASLQRCLPSLRLLHVTRAAGLDSHVLQALAGAAQPPAVLRLASLDLSGCVAASAQALLALVALCPGLVHVNLSQTAADNAVLARLAEFVDMRDSRGLEVVVLEATDITGAAARDFAAACARR
ncbi:hypothetical protein LPJ66_008887, partial [Kickxella alabastrina]